MAKKAKRKRTTRTASGRRATPGKRKVATKKSTKSAGRSDERVSPSDVSLVEGKGTTGRGAGAGGHYWHIYAGGKRVGKVYINVIEEEPFGKHASIQIYLNQQAQGKGIGRVAYRLACEQSQHDEIIAHMRKSNVSSMKAALAAGFEVVDDEKISQLAMRWTRP